MLFQKQPEESALIVGSETSALSMTLTGSQLVSAFDQISGRRKAQKVAAETNAILCCPTFRLFLGLVFGEF